MEPLAKPEACPPPYMEPLDLRTQLLARVMERAAHAEQPPPAAAVPPALTRCTDLFLESPGLQAGVTALLALVVLVTVRPPFVLRFEYDARRPWKGHMALSGFAVLLSVTLVVLVSAGIPLLLQMMGDR